MLQIRSAPHLRRLGHLLHKLGFVIVAVADTGLMDSVLLYFMTVTMAWTMAFRTVRFMPLQMQIRSFMQAGGIRKITVSTLVFMSASIIRTVITRTMGT